ncbi:MAG: TetR/AcrR family transcriptional regulator [Frankia sp.]
MVDLDRRSIAAAALAVADQHGLAGFTMRAVASALGVTPMALYHHVEDKAALAELVIDLVMSERELPPPTGIGWQEDLCEVARWSREAMVVHPAVVHLRREYRVWTPSLSAIVESWLRIWEQSGLGEAETIVAARISRLAVIGFAEEEIVIHGIDPPNRSMPSWLPNPQGMLSGEKEYGAEFELFVRSLVEGLYTRLSRTAHETAGGS